MRVFAFLGLALSLASLGCGSESEGTGGSASVGASSTTSATSTGHGGSGGGATSSSAAATGGSAAGGGGAGGGAMVDADGDGLDDAFEAKVAADYLPFLSIDPSDGCPLGGIVYRVTPHPNDPARLYVFYDHLFQNDCGLGGHVGDNEGSGITVDPSLPAPEGIIAIKSISHQNTPCQKISECGKCSGLTACDTQMVKGKATPVIFSSKDKHGSYALLSTCPNCFDSCTLAASMSPVEMVNAGEPGGHLTENLTTDGFITAANGWTEAELMNFNPWEAGKEFGGAGVVADDLVDPAFVPTVCP